MIRRATPGDADAVRAVFVRARDEMTYLPQIPDDDRCRLGGWLVGRHETWVAEEEGRVLGFAQISTGVLENLYVDPDAQRRGVGTALLNEAKRRCPGGVRVLGLPEERGCAPLLRAARLPAGRRAVRVGAYGPSSERAMTSRWISLVPS